jgi:hypothetical protein
MFNPGSEPDLCLARSDHEIDQPAWHNHYLLGRRAV